MALRMAVGALVMALAILWVPSGAAGDVPLVFAYGDHNEAPFAIVREERLEGGFLLDLGNELAARLSRTPVYRFVPRNRIQSELLAGTVDAYCLAAPEFYPDLPADRFSRPLFQDQDIIVMARHVQGPPVLDSLRGAQLGTVLGYRYPPAVEERFRTGELRRIDARNAETNLRKLAGGRLDAIILPRLGWTHAVAGEPSLARHARSDVITVATRHRSCLISPASAIAVPDLNNAILSMISDGRLDMLLASWGLRAGLAQGGGTRQEARVGR